MSRLEPGDRLGPYEVCSLLGAGGMGEVYRARDTRLGREVALKTLPEPLARDPARVARLEREARAASALNHPNIVTIYDIGAAGEHHYIVMELVDGTSRARADRAGRPPDRTAAADRRAGGGRARRRARAGDRAPRPQARERPGDRGRARQGPRLRPGAVRPEERGPQRGDAAPLLTGAGAVLGTAAYMSPGAGAGPRRRLPHRPVLAGRDALRDGRRPPAVRAARRRRRRSPPSCATRRRRSPTCRRRCSGSSSAAWPRTPPSATARRASWRASSRPCAASWRRGRRRRRRLRLRRRPRRDLAHRARGRAGGAPRSAPAAGRAPGDPDRPGRDRQDAAGAAAGRRPARGTSADRVCFVSLAATRTRRGSSPRSPRPSAWTRRPAPGAPRPWRTS